MNEETVEVVEEIKTVDSEEIAEKIIEKLNEQEPAVDSEQIANQVLEKLESMEVETTAIDSFIVENGDAILSALGYIEWWGFIGFPLVCIVTIFWLVFKEFMYTGI